MLWMDRQSRTFRIAVMLSFVVLAGLSDLYMTNIYINNFGLVEDNPLARILFTWGSTAALTATKIFSLSFIAVISVLCRKRREMEIGLVVCCLLSVFILVKWSDYNARVNAEFNDPHAAPFDGEPNWITVSPEFQPKRAITH